MKHLKKFNEIVFEELTPNIGIDNNEGEEIVEELNELLSNHFILFMKIWNFHWIMVTIGFGPFHEFFGKLYTKYFENIDKIAERIRMLSGKPIGTLQGYLGEADLDEFSGDETPEIGTMLSMILSDYEYIIKEIRELLEDEHLDNGTSKFLEDLIEDYEKDAWMLRSHIEKKETENNENEEIQ